MGCREEKDSPSRHFHVIMLRQLPRWQLQELPLIVIPNLFRDPGLILSEDGGPLTDIVAFSSDQRVFVL